MLGRPSPASASRRLPAARLGALASGLGAVLMLTACQSGQNAGSSAAAPAANNASAGSSGRIDLEDYHIIPPTAGRELGYRFDWQANALPQAGVGMRKVVRRGDSVLALDGANFLTRFRDDDGDRVWRTPVAEAVADVLGIGRVNNPDRVLLCTQTDVYSLDGSTGAVLKRAQLKKIAATAPLALPPHLIYGGRNGQVIWHAFGIGSEARAYQVGRSMQVPPIFTYGGVFAVSADGQARMLEWTSGVSMWSKDLRSRVSAEAATDGNAVFVADLGQTLWAIDAGSGRTLWRRLMTAPLKASPVYADGRIYQHVDGEGLVALEALPRNKPDGVVLWTTPVNGSVIGVIAQGVMVWDDTAREVNVLDPRRGDVTTTVSLPRVKDLTIADDGVLIAYSDDGRVLRMSPRR